MKVVAIIQARMNSSRLPGKMLLPLLDKPLVQHVIERVRRATKLDCVVLAYPLLDHPHFMPVLKSFTDTPGVPLGSWAGQGDENDLIERYLGAATAYNADIIVRIPCDNPCVEPVCIDNAVERYLDQATVLYSNTTAKVPPGPGTWIDGIGAEVFSMSRLKWLDEKTQRHPYWREHPHSYFLDHEIFSLPEASIRLDVNTQADYDVIKSIYDHFGHNRFTTAEVLAYLERKMVRAVMMYDGPITIQDS